MRKNTLTYGTKHEIWKTRNSRNNIYNSQSTNASQVFISSLNSENFYVNLLLWRFVKTVALHRVADSLTDSPGKRKIPNAFKSVHIINVNRDSCHQINLSIRGNAYLISEIKCSSGLKTNFEKPFESSESGRKSSENRHKRYYILRIFCVMKKKITLSLGEAKFIFSCWKISYTRIFQQSKSNFLSLQGHIISSISIIRGWSWEGSL